MASGKSPIANDILKRVRWLYFIFLFTGAAIFGRVLWIQYGPSGNELREKAHRITYERVVIEAERGDILASDGRLLATSVPIYDVRMDFAAAGLHDSIFDKNVDSLAYCLFSFFGDKSKNEYKRMLVNARANKGSNRYRLISPRRINHLEEKIVSGFPILKLGPNRGGYIKEKINRRIFPHGSLAERTIGMVNQSGTKVGIEGAYDEFLSGSDGLAMMQRVSGSFRIPVPDAQNVDPEHGMDVVTTLNIDLQDVAETSLKRQMEIGNSDWGTVVLMEVATGEIHAMANLSKQKNGGYKEDFNYAIGRRIEPGSTFKLATLIALLDDGKMSLDDMVDCENGTAWVGRRSIRDDHKEGVIPLRKVFAVSSNIGFAKSVHQIYGENPRRFVDYIKKMGFAEPLGIDIPGEQAPLVKEPGQPAWDGTTLVMMSYGYALEVTPMHTVSLYNAVANGGKLMKPMLVKEVRNYGQTVKEFKPQVLNKAICSPKTLELVQESLREVVDDGTGRLMRNPHYTAAVKTGTAQIALESGGYITRDGGRNYLATFVGYFPADNPKYTCIVAIKTYYGPGNRNTYYGASLAGPVFKAIADRVYASNPSWHEPVAMTDGRKFPGENSVKTGSNKQVMTVLDKLNLPYSKENKNSPWLAGIDAEFIETDSSRIFSKFSPLPLDEEEDAIPDLRGMALKDALYILESKGLRVTFEGKGKVRSQSVAAGNSPANYLTINLVLGN